MPLESEPAVGCRNSPAPRNLDGGAVEVERSREDDVFRPRPESGLEQVEEVALEVGHEIEGVLAGERTRLPVEPLVHSEVRDVLESEAGVVDHPREQRVVRLRPEGHYQRDL